MCVCVSHLFHTFYTLSHFICRSGESQGPDTELLELTSVVGLHCFFILCTFVEEFLGFPAVKC